MAVPASLLDAAVGPSEVQPEEYPYSDGRVLMETDPHANSIVAMRNQLQWHFEARTDIYVAGSMAVYYRRGDRSAVVEPDVFVVLGAEKKDRKSYRIWDEGGLAPAFVVEVASPSTSRRDATSKRATYEAIGVRECWRFDPTETLIREGLVGWRLEGGRYEQARVAGTAGWHHSEALGLQLRAEGWLLRFRDQESGRDLLTHAEASRSLQVTERRLARAVQQRDKAAQERDKAVQGCNEAARERDEAARERDEANQRIRELEARLRSSGRSG